MLKNKGLNNVKQLDKQLKKIPRIEQPRMGWINSIRNLLNISMEQLGSWLNLSGQGVYALEQREQEETITLKKLRQVADSMDMELIYNFVPRQSLQAFIEEKAWKKATDIIKKSNQTMALEAQQVNQKNLREQTKELAKELAETISNTLWE